MRDGVASVLRMYVSCICESVSVSASLRLCAFELCLDCDWWQSCDTESVNYILTLLTFPTTFDVCFYYLTLTNPIIIHLGNGMWLSGAKNWMVESKEFTRGIYGNGKCGNGKREWVSSMDARIMVPEPDLFALLG